MLWNGLSSWGITEGAEVFLKEKCPVNACTITRDQSEYQESDLVLFRDHFQMPGQRLGPRPANQLWLMYFLESPYHTQHINNKNIFNWTATYRTDSTIVAPYERWKYYNEDVRQLPLKRNYASNKTKSVAWFVSNCNARNQRLEYAKDLANYIDVDIYGRCGTKTCPRSSSSQCFDMLETDYRFYLAFENSNCVDYITEKFFRTGLGHDILPIVMGARPQDYKRAAPVHSYIHVDDFDGPEDLARYLKTLEKNDALYNEYFRWKGTGEMINTNFFCRVCSLLHDPRSYSKTRQVYDFNEWWNGEGICIRGEW